MDYAVVKLLSGDEIIARIEQHENYIVAYDPVQIVRHMTRWGPNVGVTDWLMFSREKVISIDRSKIVALSVGLEDNAVKQYLQYVQDDHDQFDRQEIQEEVDSLANDMALMLEAANTTIH